jgi:cysteine-rich repeat protein
MKRIVLLCILWLPGCSFLYINPPNCGDGAIDADDGEECDDGNKSNNDDCIIGETTGQLCVVATCGDGFVRGEGLSKGEGCDDGNTVDGDGCDSNCRPTGCGNSVITAGEQCDDGNFASGDGCSELCAFENGFTCVGEPSICDGICGDGRLVGAEVNSGSCDDANAVGGDGCSEACLVELGFNCAAGQPSVCNGICGDGLVRGAEGCDDANTTSGDGCSAVCFIETGFNCVSQPSVCQ